MIENYVNKIIQGDALQLLREIPDNSVDMTFADPPFNLKKKYNSYYDRLEVKVYMDWCEQWIRHMVRITKPTGAIFIHNIPKWLTFYVHILNEYAHFKHWISWNAPTSPMGKSLQPAHYGILFYVKEPRQHKMYEIRMPHERERKSTYLRKDYGGKKSGLHPFGPLVSDVWSDIHRIKHTKYRDQHPCQLPIPLIERLILMVTDEHDVILDPFIGTGTTAIAAKKLGRKYIGFEQDQKYTHISKQHLKNVQADSKIQHIWVSFYLQDIRTLRDQDWKILAQYFHIPSNPQDIDFTKIQLKIPKRTLNTSLLCSSDTLTSSPSTRVGDYTTQV